MIRKAIVSVLIISVAAVTGYAAKSDNTTPLAGESKSSPSGNPSYFEGVWVGSWQGYYSPGASMGVTLKIDKEIREGVFPVEYSWEAVSTLRGNFPAGTIKTSGKREGDRFHFKWKNKQGREFEFTLQKESENKVKARIDRSGPYHPHETPYSETYLNRK